MEGSAQGSAGVSPGVQKVLDKLQRSLEAGQHYEAEQMLKTVYYRYRARKQLDDAYQLLQEGAQMQLQKGQLNGGTELALLLAEAYATDRVPVSEASLSRVHLILASLPTPDGGDTVAISAAADGALRLVGATMKWCRQCGGQQHQMAKLHDDLAAYLWRVQGLAALGIVSAHYARGGDASGFAAVLRGAAAQTPAGTDEEDLFFARAVLQTLTCAPAGRDASAAQTRKQKVAYSRRLLQACLEEQSTAKHKPLVHFCDLLLQALDEHPSLKLLRLLRREYSKPLGQDPVLSALLDAVEEAYLGMQRQQGGFGNVLGDIMQMLAAPG